MYMHGYCCMAIAAWLFELRAPNEDELLNMDLGNNSEDTYTQHMTRNCHPLLQGLGQGL